MLLSQLFGRVFMEAAEAGGAQGAGAPSAPTEAAPATVAPAGTEQAPPANPVPEAQAEDDYLATTGWGEVMGEFEGKPAVSMALDFVAKAGISLEDPAVQLAAQEGDFTMLKAKLSAEGVQGYEPMLAILEAESKAYFAEQEKAKEQTAATITNVLGEDTEQIFAWGRESMSDSEKEAFNSMFDAGGEQAIIAAIALGTLYNTHFEGTKPAANLTANLATVAPSSANSALSAREFAAEVEELGKRYGSDTYATQEYKALQARREAGRNRGI